MNIPKQFSKALKILAAAPLLAGSMAASAALIEVSYEGTVYSTSGDGAGYSVGDFLSGTFTIDTDPLPADRNSRPEIVDYYQVTAADGDFVSDGVANDNGLYDRLYVADNYGGFDRFYVMDRDYRATYTNSANRSTSDRYFNLHAYGSADFVTGVTADQIFDLSAGDVGNGYMRGIIYDRAYTLENGVATTNRYGYAQFTLAGLSVGPAQVPAPTSVALLGLGLLGLGAARRRKARAAR